MRNSSIQIILISDNWNPMKSQRKQYNQNYLFEITKPEPEEETTIIKKKKRTVRRFVEGKFIEVEVDEDDPGKAGITNWLFEFFPVHMIHSSFYLIDRIFHKLIAVLKFKV